MLAGWSFSSFFAQPPAEPTNKPQTGTYIIDTAMDMTNVVWRAAVIEVVSD